jgi:hypothetical protein
MQTSIFWSVMAAAILVVIVIEHEAYGCGNCKDTR